MMFLDIPPNLLEAFRVIQELSQGNQRPASATHEPARPARGEEPALSYLTATPGMFTLPDARGNC